MLEWGDWEVYMICTEMKLDVWHFDEVERAIIVSALLAYTRTTGPGEPVNEQARCLLADLGWDASEMPERRRERKSFTSDSM